VPVEEFGGLCMEAVAFIGIEGNHALGAQALEDLTHA
jgi:hypothetical protein